MSDSIELKKEYGLLIQWRGTYREMAYEIKQHSFRVDDPVSMFSPLPCSWCTYVVMSDEMHSKIKDRVDGAPWNGGQTYYRKVTEEHVGMSPELAEKWNAPYWKIGDDFQHLWDNESFHRYSKEFMERHIKEVIDYLLDNCVEDKNG